MDRSPGHGRRLRLACAALVLTEHEPPKAPTYADLWDSFASGQMSTTVMVSLLRSDEVFAAYCIRRARLIREEHERRNRSAF